jgi:hypothetical protein
MPTKWDDTRFVGTLIESHGGEVGITSDGGQLVMSCGDLSDPWIANDHKHAVIRSVKP